MNFNSLKLLQWVLLKPRKKERKTFIKKNLNKQGSVAVNIDWIAILITINMIICILIMAGKSSYMFKCFILLFSYPELKASSELFWSPFVRCPSVCKLFTFSTSSQEPLGWFQSNLSEIIFMHREFRLVQMKVQALIKGDNWNNIKNIKNWVEF